MTSAEVLEPVTDGVWLALAPVSVLGTRLTATMTVLRLAADELLLHSPLTATASRRRAVEALGRPAHLYAPNLFHHRWIGEWAAAYPEARLHAPAGLAARRPDLRIDRAHDQTGEPAFAGLLDEVPVRGFRLRETVLLHRPSATLVVADLVHNIGRSGDPWTRLYTSAMGFHDRIALSRMIRWTGFDDRAAARGSIERLLQLGFDRVVVGHGRPIGQGARSALASAYAWLRP